MHKLLALSVFCAGLLLAQGERSALDGTVTDGSGAVIPDAAVVARELQTGVEIKTSTTEAGVYRLPYLPPGKYRVTATKQGFRTALADNVELRVAQTLTVDIKMDIGQTSDQVTVSSETPLIETGTAEIGRYVSTKEFETWPVAVGDGRRQIQSFIFRSMPGTVGGEFQGSINGGQQYSHEILIEGMPLGRFDLQGGSNNELSPSAEAISEFKLQTGTIGAQYGGGQTAVANFAIKSGTNRFHGSAYDYVQNDALRANSFANNAIRRPRPPFKLNNWGGSIGGPVMIPKVYNGKNKTFFFANYEVTRQRNFTSTSLGTLPTIDFKRGDFSRLLDPAYTGNSRSGTTLGQDALGRDIRFGQIFDPSSTRTVNGQVVRDVFPGNIIPVGRWSSVSRNIVQQVGITDPINSFLFNNIPVLASGQPVFDEKMFAIKGDQVMGSRHRLSAYYSFNDRVRNNSPGGRYGNPPGLPTGVYQLQSTPGKLARLSEDWTVTSAVLNHFAVGYNRFGNYNESVFVDQDWAGKIGLKNTAPTTFPVVQFQGPAILGGTLGASNRLGSGNAGFSFNGSTIVQDDVSIIRGKHSFRTGFEQRYYYYNSRNKPGTGSFNFNPIQTEAPGFNSSTGNAFASFLLGTVAGTSRGLITTNPGHRVRQTALYFADDWKATQRLTLNLGLRWEIIGGVYEVAGRMATLDPDAPNAAAGGRLGAIVFAENVKRKGFQNRNWLQLGPRLGFAYILNNRAVLRGGYGVNNMPPITGFSLPPTYGYNGSITVNSSNTPLQFPQDPVLQWDNPYPNFTGVLPNKDATLQNNQGVIYISPESNRLGYVQNYSLGLQFQLPAKFVLDTTYIGNKGTRLISTGLDSLNQLPVSALKFGDALIQPLSTNSGLAPLPFAGFNGTLAQALRRFPQYQGVSYYRPNFGYSSYNSLQVAATRHFTGGFSALIAYTFSKTLTNVESPLDSVSAQDVYNRGLEKSIASFHIPHFLKATWIYELPIGPGKAINIGGIAGKLIGGWIATGVHNYRSGDPLAISTAGYRSDAIFNGAVRPDLVAGVPIVIDKGGPVQFGTGTPYLNPAAFTQIPLTPNGVPLRLGTAPRILPNVRGPSYATEDFGVSKRFAFTESAYVEFKADAFNALNRAGRGNPVTDITSPLFGRITGTQQGPRSLQLSLRVNF